MNIGSLSYRKNAEAVWRGDAPDKYRRLLPHITGKHILEMGAAEGVLALLLADRDPDAHVMGLEMSPERHEVALALKERWLKLGKRVQRCDMVQGDIRSSFSLLYGVDTFVAIRAIYHLRESIDAVFDAVALRVPNVVLCGNPNRARRYTSGESEKKDNLGAFNYYAGVEGMKDVLETHGYTIGTVVSEGDPIVTGHR